MRVTVANAAGEVDVGGTAPVDHARFPLGVRRFTLWLVGLAALLTLGHLLGPQSDTLAIESHEHDAEQEHPETPSHDHGAHACGLMIQPDTVSNVSADTATDPIEPDSAEPAVAIVGAIDVRDRSPTDLVAELQVNRV